MLNMDEIDAFMDYGLTHGITDKTRRELIDLLKRKGFPLHVVSVHKLRTSRQMDRREYLRMAKALHMAGYRKDDIWFIYGDGEK